jgi:acetyl coenzyme A synthetase (ADP forming)-like protein
MLWEEEMTTGIESIFSPSSIAVVGATNRPGSVGLAVFSNLILAGYQGILYPVNPKARSVQGVKAYPTVAEVPDDIDLALVIVPADLVATIVEECAHKKAKAAIVITAGFKEVGGRGVELEAGLKDVARTHGIRLVGPNCLGSINTNPRVCMNASFARIMPRPGRIAFISQSGALCTAVLDYAAGRNIGFSKFISFGNKADVDEIDLLRHLKDDPDTDVILMYLEDITSGREFVDTARQITWEAGKPTLVVKSGRSAEGAKAAASHTGSLAGSDATYDAIFYQGGIQRVETIDELFDTAIAFARQPMPKGNRVAIVTNAGGPGILATDAAIRYGLTLAALSEPTKERLREHLPPTASVQNPVDVIGDATHERYEAAIREVLLDEGVDGAIVILTPQAMTDILETAEIVPRVAKATDKPVLCSFMGIVDVSEGVRYLERQGIPNYAFPEAAARSMAAMVRFQRRRLPRKRDFVHFEVDVEEATRIMTEKLAGKERHYMGEKEANEILHCYGFPLLKSRLIRDPAEIASALQEVSLPVAMKIVSPDIVHKFDVGGVRLKIKTLDGARRAYDEIMEAVRRHNPSARLEGILMEAMARGGVEVILGAARDPRFGPICMFGLGGTFVEAMRDVTFRIAPMWESSAENMITSIKAYRILRGVRGIPPSDTKAIKECILRLSQLVNEHPEIAELDINPLIVYPEGQGCVVADSRMLLVRPSESGTPQGRTEQWTGFHE